ncbi:hypothetical protein SAMN04488112_1168 [Melghirimyces thermohalophilus]|uniref:Uncharacterized protein n=1 Tax=Melghirimyces thermohalophilus TaxID=1236220 RepID=A0A1G6P9G4_9BACL|nr:hypothetical protein [Melghirimyces thermohalophilus]SDC76910.1 hypothetical protein SAMN04488112_1168 [Melghirimyces thermohalophilus]
MSAKFEAPEHIVDCVEQYKESGEKYNILNSRIKVKNDVFYHVIYHIGNSPTGDLIIRQDGSIPFLDEIKDAMIIGSQVRHKNKVLYTNGKEFVNMKHERFMRKTLQLLNKIESKLRDSMPSGVQKALEEFKRGPETTLEQQPRLREFYHKADRLIKRMVQDRLITQEDFDLLDHYIDELGKAAFLQNDVQMNTYSARKKVIRYLFSTGKIILAFRLWISHLRMHPEKPKHPKAHEEVKRYIYDGEELEEYKENIKKLFEQARNPRRGNQSTKEG